MVMRARLKEANGTADNQVTMIFPQQGPAPLRPAQLVAMMNHWLDTVAADASNASAAVKVARDKPGDVVDACYTQQGERIVESQTWDGKGRCNELYPAHADPHIAAGAPLTDEVLKCQLKPIVATDYTPALTADQMTRMKAAFPQGVCDYSKPGVAQQHVEGTWRRY
jgi:hypothetical protein